MLTIQRGISEFKATDCSNIIATATVEPIAIYYIKIALLMLLLKTSEKAVKSFLTASTGI